MSKYYIAFHTLGCKLNFSETSHLSRMLEKDFFEVVSFKDKADIYVINSCCVTETAEKKSKNAISSALKKNSNAKICLIGCFSELNKKELLKNDKIDIVLGSADKFMLAQNIYSLLNIHNNFDTEQNCGSFHSSWSEGDRTRTFLKIQDGCDYHCSYCTVAIARGISRSDKIANVVENANSIVSKGINEIILTGVNIGDFGKNNNENFLELLFKLEKIENLKRIRISSIEPNLLTNDIIDFVADSKKIMPHFHIPLQSGNNRILSLMKRRYTRELFKEKICYIKNKIKNCYIAADVIIGFPTESDDDFIDTYNFIKSLNISDLHIFSYSKRPNTIAEKMEGHISEKIKKERNKLMRDLSKEIKKNMYLQNFNNQLDVLFESKNNSGYISGFSDNYLKCIAQFNKELINKIVKIKILNFDENSEVFIVEPIK